MTYTAYCGLGIERPRDAPTGDTRRRSQSRHPQDLGLATEAGDQSHGLSNAVGTRGAMTSESVEFFRLFVTFVGGGFVTLVLAQPVKDWWDRRRQRLEQQQTRWAPLRRSARSLEARFGELASIYSQQPPADQWAGHTYHIRERQMTYPSMARDFRELYLLDGDGGPITDFYAGDLPSPIGAREDSARINKMWTRLHELTFAASSLHKMAEFLAYAERVRTELEDGRLIVSSSDRARMLEALLKVRQTLSGGTGAGVIVEHQQLIAENVWRADGSVVDLYSFYRMLLGPEWPKFTSLLRFFLNIQYKIEYEVLRTRATLDELCCAVEAQFPALRSNVR